MKIRLDRETKTWVKRALQQRGKYEQEWWFGRWQPLMMLLYTAKACLCLLLDLQDQDEGVTYRDKLDQMAFGPQRGFSTPDGSGYEWEALAVGKGLFSNWWVEIYWDSSL